MLDTSSPKTIRREIIIAGKSAGKPVSITPIAEPVYNEMVKLARRGNYWAGLCVNGVHSLVNGRLHQNNIFVKPGPVLRNGHEEFVMILPGCKVTVEKLANDGFKVLYFKADLDYFELQKRGEAPGLYRAENRLKGWSTDIEKNGRVENKEDRLVAIADANHKDVDLAAKVIAPRLADVPFSGGGLKVNKNGFDIHYTPGVGCLGGLTNYKKAVNPNNNQDIYGSALLLAKSMYDARDINGVGWVSEFGGSAILTQAMTILAAQGVKLEKHSVFLYRPTTSPNKAVQAAHAIGVTLDRKFSKTNSFDYMGNRDQLGVILSRLKHEDDYSIFKAGADLIDQGKSAQGLATTLAGIAGAVGVSMSAPAAAIPFLTAMAAVAAKAGAALATVKLGATVAEAKMPATYDRFKGKI